MTQQHPITPPPELEKQWFAAWERDDNEEIFFADFVIPRAAAWGADQELEACCALMDDWGLDGEDLMLCRRPKPPSLKEQALAALERYEADEWCEEMTIDSSIIRHALEQLDD